jgi:hypothetical protein
MEAVTRAALKSSIPAQRGGRLRQRKSYLVACSRFRRGEVLYSQGFINNRVKITFPAVVNPYAEKRESCDWRGFVFGTTSALEQGMTHEPVVLVVEFSVMEYDARTKNTARVLSVSVTEAGAYRVEIQAEAAGGGNCRFVTLSDEVMPANVYETVIRAMIAGLTGATIRVGTI